MESVIAFQFAVILVLLIREAQHYYYRQSVAQRDAVFEQRLINLEDKMREKSLLAMTPI